MSTNSFGHPGVSINFNVTNTSQNAQVVGKGPIGQSTYRFVCAGTQNIFVKFGTDNSVTADTTASMELLANSVEVFNGPNNMWVAVIAGGSGSTLNITPGEGV